jgi:hypothetical protein
MLMFMFIFVWRPLLVFSFVFMFFLFDSSLETISKVTGSPLKTIQRAKSIDSLISMVRGVSTL